MSNQQLLYQFYIDFQYFTNTINIKKLSGKKAPPKLFQLLTQLDRHEWHRLETFVHSPYFNTRSEVQQLLAELRPFHPDYGTVKKTDLYLKLRPNETYDRKWMNDLLSALSRLVAHFWAIEQLLTSEAAYQRAYRNGLRHHVLDQLADRHFQAELKREKSSEMIDIDRAFIRWSLYHETYAVPSRSRSGEERHEEVEGLNQYLDLHYLLLKLRYFCDRENRKFTYEEDFEDPMEAIVVQQAALLRHRFPVLDLYYRLYLLFHKETWEASEFLELQDLFYELSDHLAPNERGFLVIKLAGLANKKYQSGESDFIRHLFDLYRFGVEQGAFDIGRLFPDTTFLNICTVGSYVGEFEWVQEFIDTHRPRLPSEAADAADLGEASLHFHQKDYQQAYELTQAVLNRQFAYRVRIQSLGVRCLLVRYLKGEVDYYLTFDKLEAFGQYLNRDKGMAPERRRQYRTFRLAAKRIIQLKLYHWDNETEKAKVVQWIDQQPAMMFRQWLLEQLEAAWVGE
ncbi:MAG: hypothetical protein R2824_35425 [Saprospiraceae bacterium]